MIVLKGLKQLYQIEVDPHTHSICSGHSYSTVMELAACAKEAGLRGFVLTDHSPSMPGGPVFFHTSTYTSLPPVLCGVRVFYGMELDIVDYEGGLGLGEQYRSNLQFAIASFHDSVINPGSPPEVTQAAIGALNTPLVDMLGHPGNPRFPVDIPAVVREAKRLNKLIEINNHSPEARKGSRERCLLFLEECKRQDVRVALSSDAHIATSIGHVEKCFDLLLEANFPEELIVNLTLERFQGYIEERAARLAAQEGAKV